MMKFGFGVGILFNFAVLSAAFGQGSYQVISPDPGDTSVTAEDISADGNYVVGSTGLEATRWSAAGGYERLGWLPDPSPASRATAISADGSIVVGWSNDTFNVQQGFRWDAVTGLSVLEPLSYSAGIGLSGGQAIGNLGQLIGGYSYDLDIDQGTLWTSPATPAQVGVHGPYPWSFVWDIADEVPVAVGSSWGGFVVGTQGFTWDPIQGTVPIGFPQGASSTRATAVSADGDVVFGNADFPSGQQAFRWKAATGFELLPGGPTGASFLRVRACNAAGTAAVGNQRVASTTSAFYWSEGTGWMNMRTFLQTRGATVFGSSPNLQPNAMSADGNIIIGSVGSLPYPVWFMAHLSPTDPVVLGTSYCPPTVPNSHGGFAELEAVGSSSLADNDLVLTGSQLPENVFAYLLASQTQAVLPAYNGSSGTFCLGGMVHRLNQSNQIMFSGSFQRVALRLQDVNQPIPSMMIQSGQTWNFQVWYRDQTAGAPTSNFSSGTEITFQ